MGRQAQLNTRDKVRGQGPGVTWQMTEGAGCGGEGEWGHTHGRGGAAEKSFLPERDHDYPEVLLLKGCVCGVCVCVDLKLMGSRTMILSSSSLDPLSHLSHCLITVISKENGWGKHTSRISKAQEDYSPILMSSKRILTLLSLLILDHILRKVLWKP